MKKILILRPDETFNELFLLQTVDENIATDILEGEVEEIPYFTLFEKKKIALLQNESSKLMNFPPTIRVVDNGRLIDVLCGNILVVGIDEEEYVGLNEKQVAFIKKMIKTADVAFPTPFLINIS